MVSAVTAADKRIDAERERIRKASPVVGERRTNGTVITNPQLERAAKTIADHQIIEAIRAIRMEADAVCVPALQYLERAARHIEDVG